jgi:hypothetical protein
LAGVQPKPTFDDGVHGVFFLHLTSSTIEESVSIDPTRHCIQTSQ